MSPEAPKTYGLAQQARMLRGNDALIEGVDYIVPQAGIAYYLLKTTGEAVDSAISKNK